MKKGESEFIKKMDQIMQKNGGRESLKKRDENEKYKPETRFVIMVLGKRS